MRAVRLIFAVLIVSPILVLALSESRLSRQPFAQVTAAPGPVTLTAPVAPGQPQAFSTIGALPALAAAPGTVPAWSCDRGADAARISMHLFGAGNLDRVGGRRLVVQLCSREPIRARPVRQLPAERERAVAVHTARGDPPRAATAADLQRDGVHAAHAGGNFGRRERPPAALAGTAFDQSMLAMRVQLTRASRLLFSDLREPAPSP